MLTVKSIINIASQAAPPIITAVQGDTGRSIEFTVADFTIPEGTTATYYIQKPSGNSIYNMATISGNVVTVDLTAQSLAESGDNFGQIRIMKNGEIVTSFDFILLVKAFRGIDATESTTEMNVFDQAVNAALEEIDGSLENIVAEEFDPANSYLAGEYVLKDGAFYKFTTNHTGVWSTSDVEETTIGEELTNGGGGSGAVNSVNGKTGTVVLDAGDLEYDDEETYSAGSVGAELTSLKGGLNDIDESVDAVLDTLVESQSQGAVTLTNMENSSDYYDGMSGNGFSSTSKTGGVALFTTNTSSETSPYVNDNNALTASTLLIGFKFRFTKVDQALGDPENFRVIAGSSNSKDFTATFGVWHEYSEVLTISGSELKRLRISARNFATAPTQGQMTLEVKEMYIYDVSAVSAEMRTYIQSQQSTNYQDGTVTYGESGETTYLPDITLAISGKSADSKTVGDAIAEVQINVKKYGVKGDGTTDDTDAINDLFAAKQGNFYFPSGTYKITGTIELPADSSIIGDGDTSIISMTSCDDLTECTFRVNEKVYPYILIAEDNCAVKKIKLQGNNTLQEKRHAGIGILDAENCSVEDVTVYNINYDSTQEGTATVSGYGICVDRSDYVNVERCYVEQCGYECIGIVDDCNFCTVKDCYTKNGWRTCIQVHRGSCNTLIENCYMMQTHNKYDACFTVHGVQNQEVENLRVVNCSVECTQNGAQTQSYCAPYQIMSYSEYLVFSGNRASGGKRAFYIDSSSTNAKIVGNDFQCNSASDYGVTIGSLSTIVMGNCLVNAASTPVNSISNNPIIYGNIGIGDTIINGNGVSF